MRDNDKETTLTKVQRRGTWQLSRDSSDSDGTVNRLTMCVIGATALFAGLWALACLANALLHTGPFKTIGQLAAAVTGH